MRLNTFDVFSDNDKTLLAYSRDALKELRLRLNKFAILTVADDFQGKVTRYYIMVQEEQLTNFIFQLSFKQICSLRIWRIR
jgi:hypothetical protein